MKKIADVTPFLYDNNLLLSLSCKWLEVFDGYPKFSVIVKDGKLVLESQKIGGKK